MKPTPRPTGPFASRRVLVVEDNEDAAESLREALVFSGHQVEVALTGPAAVAAARKGGPEILLCDIGLPELDGYGVARAIRGDSDPGLRSMYLVALSGYAHREDVTRARGAGFDRHLVKPTSIETLTRVIEEAFKHE
jgi:two-component system CheB/CheR fusion protein